MKENGIPSVYQANGQSMGFSDISRQFNASKYGEMLKNNIRFGTFKPEDASNAQWEKLLGADVNNLNHLQVSLGLTKSFLRHCANPDSSWQGKVPKEASFSPQEQSLLQLTAIVHDWGEAIIGDISLPQKTKADEEKEMVALRGLVYEVLGDQSNEIFCEAIADNVGGILSDHGTKLGKAFNAIEYVGYMRTGLRSWQRSRIVESSTRPVLEQMGSRVVFGAIPKLVGYSEMYPPVRSYLEYHHESLIQILEQPEERFGYLRSPDFSETKVLWARRLVSPI